MERSVTLVHHTRTLRTIAPLNANCETLSYSSLTAHKYELGSNRSAPHAHAHEYTDSFLATPVQQACPRHHFLQTDQPLVLRMTKPFEQPDYKLPQPCVARYSEIATPLAFVFFLFFRTGSFV